MTADQTLAHILAVAICVGFFVAAIVCIKISDVDK